MKAAGEGLRYAGAGLAALDTAPPNSNQGTCPLYVLYRVGGVLQPRWDGRRLRTCATRERGAGSLQHIPTQVLVLHQVFELVEDITGINDHFLLPNFRSRKRQLLQ